MLVRSIRSVRGAREGREIYLLSGRWMSFTMEGIVILRVSLRMRIGGLWRKEGERSIGG